MSLTTSGSNSFASYSIITSVTVLVYDLLVLLPTEIDAVIVIKFLHSSSAAQCRLLYTITGPLGIIGIFASQVILMILSLVIELKTSKCGLLAIRDSRELNTV
ncbi:hypothetical protein ARMGADRAFT_1030707 [Armillaria gallica]|uniref:Uncharacterized protein n=1 Tax=Armillaria gallica TaxID=47427 RepID=A0A2H3DAY7_ARMGA|nr:hypothetical protein ARMGADRAFT_1030707 [Armillaria gallica]